VRILTHVVLAYVKDTLSKLIQTAVHHCCTKKFVLVALIDKRVWRYAARLKLVALFTVTGMGLERKARDHAYRLMIETYAFAMRTLFLKVRIRVCGTHILSSVRVRTELRVCWQYCGLS